ncbi:MAG: hypothetical protein JXA99_13335 [Candidatus Lokiarchaeota archaeon]|nr:hypothetical protein [Candidatus Lokiarchaeota archaeon]
MKIQIGKMIFHGIIAAIFYLGIPYAILFALDYYGLLELNMAFIWGLLPFAIAGIVITMLRHAYPKDTVNNRLLMFLTTVYSGLYLFYIFGGFTPGVELGNFSITTDFAEVTVGIKLIAWLLLIGSALAGLRYLFEAIEIHMKNKSDDPRTGSFKMFRIFKGLGLLTSLVLMGYIFTLVISGITLRPNLHDFSTSHDNGLDGNPYTSDDIFALTLLFDMKNGGIYSMTDVYISIDLYVHDCNDTSILPRFTKVGSTINSSVGDFPAFSETYNHNVTCIIDPLHILDIFLTETIIDMNFHINASYGGIFVDFRMNVTTPMLSP